MYTREILPPEPGLVRRGIALEGAWAGALASNDISDVAQPYRFYAPKWFKELRIKEWQCFMVQNEDLYLEALLGNAKSFHAAQALVYNKSTEEWFRFRKLLPLGSWRLPRELYHSSISSRSYGFFFRIHDWLDAGMIKVDLDIGAKRRRPALAAHLEFDFEGGYQPVTTALTLGRRPMYVFKGLAPVRGDLVFEGRHISLDPARTSGLVRDYKGYFPYRMRDKWCSALGFDGQGRRFGFSLGENQAADDYRNNENLLWTANGLTPLPPVRITWGEGVDGDWTIQDVEGMVDLTFTPQETIHSGYNIFLFHVDYSSPIGYYNGMLLDSEGLEVPIRNLWGLGENLYLRV
jgi:hypothetical protein